MSTSQCAADPGLADSQPDLVPSPSAGASRHLKGVLIGFAATVTIGLALASWYVGARIVDANETVPVSTMSASQPVPTPQPASLAGLSARPAPPLPDLYLQVAGLGPRKDSSFVKSLEAKGYRARVVVNTKASTNASAANQEDSRILIGPFVGRSSLEAAARKLQSAGVLAIETAY
jgi:hypothetical protein